MHPRHVPFLSSHSLTAHAWLVDDSHAIPHRLPRAASSDDASCSVRIGVLGAHELVSCPVSELVTDNGRTTCRWALLLSEPSWKWGSIRFHRLPLFHNLSLCPHTLPIADPETDQC